MGERGKEQDQVEERGQVREVQVAVEVEVLVVAEARSPNKLLGQFLLL